MKTKTKIYLLLVLCSIFAFGNMQAKNAMPESTNTDFRQLYKELQLMEKVNYQAFCQAVAGYHKIQIKKTILTVIDFSKPSTEERFFVIDMQARKVLFASLVAHGQKSGENYAVSFSNEVGSKKSSLGFYITEQTYNGAHGLSLILDGLEQGINHNAKSRAVVIHAADYCSEKNIRSCGRLGRSWGCPALPPNITKEVIETIKGGSVVYIYSERENDKYLAHSRIL